MPELPEVETVRRGLITLLPGQVIKKVTHDTPKSFPNAAADVEQFVIGAQIVDVRRRAKVLMIDLDTEYSLLIHLKMTGQLVYLKDGLAPPFDSEINSESTPYPLKPAQSAREVGREGSSLRFGAGHPNDSLVGELPDKTTRVALEFEDDSKLFFNDQRKFGWMRLMPTVEIPNIDFMKKVGPEPLEASFTVQEFIQRIQKRANTTIKAALLDQTVVAGVGNIYADESLWGAKIHPATRVKDVPENKLKNLFKELRHVLELSIEKGGSTDRNYVNAEGKKGSYINFARVFRKEGTPCQRHPETLIQKIRVAGRGTHICPQCQVL